MRTTSYPQRQTEGRITLDLITIASYSVGGTEIVVPQRVDGEALALDASRPSARSARREDSIASPPVEEQARLRELLASTSTEIAFPSRKMKVFQVLPSRNSAPAGMTSTSSRCQTATPPPGSSPR